MSVSESVEEFLKTGKRQERSQDRGKQLDNPLLFSLVAYAPAFEGGLSPHLELAARQLGIKLNHSDVLSLFFSQPMALAIVSTLSS
jgi:hypothetical protein